MSLGAPPGVGQVNGCNPPVQTPEGACLMSSVLDGLRVVDLTVARAGPVAVRMLAEWGASVTRVEMPGVPDGIAGDHKSSDYINIHGNKRLINLDLKQERG